MQRKAAFLLSTAIAVLSFKSVAIADFTATPMPVFVSQPNIEYVEYLPTRPKDAGDLRVAVAIYESYDFVKSLAPAMLIHVRDSEDGCEALGITCRTYHSRWEAAYVQWPHVDR